MKLCLRKVVVMLLMVISFLVFWYPLFILTILDVSYSKPPQAYRACMIIAWTHPITTPFFCGIIYFDMISMENLTRSVYSAAIPMKDSTSFSSASLQRDEARHKMHHRYKMYDLGFTNENFSYSHHSSPCHVHRDADPEDPSSCGGEGSAGYSQHDTEVHSMPCSLPHSVLSEGQAYGLGHLCSTQDSHQTLIMWSLLHWKDTVGLSTQWLLCLPPCSQHSLRHGLGQSCSAHGSQPQDPVLTATRFWLWMLGTWPLWTPGTWPHDWLWTSGTWPLDSDCECQEHGHKTDCERWEHGHKTDCERWEHGHKTDWEHQGHSSTAVHKTPNHKTLIVKVRNTA